MQQHKSNGFIRHQPGGQENEQNGGQDHDHQQEQQQQQVDYDMRQQQFGGGIQQQPGEHHAQQQQQQVDGGIRQQRSNEDMQQQPDEYYPQQHQELQQPQQGWMTNDWQYGGKENDCISQNCDKYMNSLNPMNPINLYGDKPQLGHIKYGYSALTILREVSLTSENLQNWAILDSGASSHFLLSTAPLLNNMVAYRPVKQKIAKRQYSVLEPRR